MHQHIIDIRKDLSFLFSQQARATPDATALEDGERKWTYAELDREVDALASRLRRCGVGRDSLVGVLLARTADYVLACLAALRAGGAFLVLELAYPPSLLAEVVQDARPVVIVTHTDYTSRIPADIPKIVLDEPLATSTIIQPGCTTEEMRPLPADDDLERLAFVSYSSGTTGRPKGIANPHSAPVRSYDLRFALSDLFPGDRVACNVFFVWEILRPLLRGATVIVVPDEASYDPVALVDLLSSARVTETLMTPTLLATVLSRHGNLGMRLPELRTLWLNGEVVTTDLAGRAIKALPKTRLLNCYSASETHEIACGDIRSFLDDQSPICPVGLPMDPDHTYILGENGDAVPPGAMGELYVGGGLLARGYLNLPETTAKVFLPDPFDATPGARMYKTGDLARILPSGAIEISGRVGGMIKVRGYTIQPAAVESAIVKHLAVRHCAVTSHGDGLERQLVAYIVCDNEEPSGRPAVVADDFGHSPQARRVLSPHLAHYMIPTFWVEVPALPTHSISGKIDLKRLPPPKTAETQANASILTTKETAGSNRGVSISDIARHWALCLDVPLSAVTEEHDFFDLGGHSLAFAALASCMSAEFGFTVPLIRLVADPTLQGHLKVVTSARVGHTGAAESNLCAMIRHDCVLPEDVKSLGASFRPLREANTILLTGVTGFLGGFILDSLLHSTSSKILCLVRLDGRTSAHNSPSDGMARLRKHLLGLGIWDDTIPDRVEIVPGDLARTHLGLSQEAFEELASRTQVIIHAGAAVNLVYPYAALRDANVGGTSEILRLASRSGATVHHISTNGVLPPADDAWPESAAVDMDSVTQQLRSGYDQTKWVAEQLVHEAGRRGLLVRIYRPGTIGGHSLSGSTNSSDLINALIVESLQIGHAPDVEGWHIEMTPVDFVSRALVTLANNTQSSQHVFHLGDPRPTPAKSIFGTLSKLGYPTLPLGWDEWLTLWRERREPSSRKSDSLATANILHKGMPTVDFLEAVVALDDSSTTPFLAPSGLQRPQINEALLRTYTRHFYARGWLPYPPTPTVSNKVPPREVRPLSGRVAIVTGASSGIGAAVAAALAREGSHVALAARRIDALEAVRNRLSAYGGKVIAFQTDVTDRGQVESLVQATSQQLGPVDIVVVCAGVMYYTMMANAQVEDWDRTVDVNCKGLLHCLASVVPSMLARARGHIVAISSDASRKVFPGLGVYSASKFFVEATLQSLRLETVGSGLRVTSIQPGNTATELLGMSTDAEAIKRYGEPSGAKVLDADDVAAAVIFALRQPPHVAVNEVLIEPRDEPV